MGDHTCISSSDLKTVLWNSEKNAWLVITVLENLPNKNIGTATLVHTDIECKSSYQWILCYSLQVMLSGKMKFRKHNGLDSKPYCFPVDFLKPYT